MIVHDISLKLGQNENKVNLMCLLPKNRKLNCEKLVLKNMSESDDYEPRSES